MGARRASVAHCEVVGVQRCQVEALPEEEAPAERADRTRRRPRAPAPIACHYEDYNLVEEEEALARYEALGLIPRTGRDGPEGDEEGGPTTEEMVVRNPLPSLPRSPRHRKEPDCLRADAVA